MISDKNVNFILKHKNINVADIIINNGDITDVTSIYEPEHLPYKYVDDKAKNISLLNSWVEHRGVPFSREDYDAIMNEFNVSSSKELTVLSYGLNLTDHYWLCEKNSEKKWEDVNFFDNIFSERIGKIMPELGEKYQNFINPDLSSNGRLKKFWIINNGKRELCKAGSGDLKQEPFNEYIASQIAERLNINHVNYELKKHNNEIYSKCACMIDKNLEFVNAFSVYLEGEKTGDKYNDYLNACAKMGISGAREEVDKMIILDYLIRNTDRHVGNFGVLRNSETLKWVKIAPVFDNGNSLWHNAQGVRFINADSKSECRSFTGENERNVLLAGDVGWYDKNKLNDTEKIITGAFKLNKNIENERIDKIIGEFKKRANNLDIVLERNMENVKLENGVKRRRW
jgi:hypothetical protein